MSAKEMIISKLEELDVCIHDDGDDEYTVRCPYCGDSKNPEHAHLGIQIDLDDPSMPMLWNCLKCGEGGILSEQLLADLGLYLSDDEYKELKMHDRKVKRLAGPQRIKNGMNRYKVPFEASKPQYLAKLDYIHSRIGHMIDPAKHKIIMSLIDFLVYNEIDPAKIPKLNPTAIEILDKFYVGFLSANNNCITFRRIIDKKGLRRYHKLILNPFIDEKASFYSIPMAINLLYTEPLNVYISEGTFDIISVRHNLIGLDSPNSLFYAACGYSYINIIRYMVKRGICTGLNVHVFADRDKTDEDHLDMIQNSPLSAFIEHFYLHRNAMPGEKDYGVVRDAIKDTSWKLW